MFVGNSSAEHHDHGSDQLVIVMSRQAMLEGGCCVEVVVKEM